ncbi:MAG: elongation factor 1-beta [Candidatus Diapherotrites archaeon]|nr:elongation factor 1-beta [Candidatus Diapherotrites archaeon]
MGLVFTVYDIMPEDMENFDQLKEDAKKAMPEKAELADVKEEPVAFGLKKLRLGVKTPDEPGISDKVEENLRAMANVQSLEISAVTLL